MPTHAYAFALSAIVWIGIIVLLILNHIVPESLYTFGYATATGGLGLAIPAAGTSKTATPPAPVKGSNPPNQ